MATPALAPLKPSRRQLCYCGKCRRCKIREATRKYRANLNRKLDIAAEVQEYLRLVYIRDVLYGPDATELGSSLRWFESHYEVHRP